MHKILPNIEGNLNIENTGTTEYSDKIQNNRYSED
jgi:hypothetical protein